MLEKNKKRALRRHHLDRMKKKAQRVYYYLPKHNASKLANHIKCCSCYMCGNQRRYFGRPFREAHMVKRFKDFLESKCDHEYHEAVDEDGGLIEPAHDVCVHCGETRH